MTPETARTQILSSHLSSAMTEVVVAQAEVLVLRRALSDANDRANAATERAERWEAKCRSLVSAEDFEAIHAEMAGEVEAD